MKDTMKSFLDMLDNDISNYATKILLAESAANAEAVALADEVKGDWQPSYSVLLFCIIWAL